MTLKKLFSSLTFISVFLLGTILLIGLTSTRDFIYTFIPFMLLMAIFLYFLIHDYIGEKSDKATLFVCLLLVFFVGAFFFNGFKMYSDSLQAANPVIKAQVIQNEALLQHNVDNLNYANEMKKSIDQNKKNSLILYSRLTGLIIDEQSIIDQTLIDEQLTEQAAADELARQEAIRQQAIINAQNKALEDNNNNRFYEWDEDDD